MVLTKGHGKLMFVGNVSVEEGRIFFPQFFAAHTHTKKDVGREHVNASTVFYFQNKRVIVCVSGCSPAGLHDLTSPDLSIASEWYVRVRTANKATNERDRFISAAGQVFVMCAESKTLVESAAFSQHA